MLFALTSLPSLNWLFLFNLQCKDDPKSFVATFTDGSVVEMSIDEVNKARRLFDTEWSKLVVDADVPKAVASSIDIHNAVNSGA